MTFDVLREEPPGKRHPHEVSEILDFEPHDEDHTVASHSDTTATGPELETLTDGSNADSLHVHSSPGVVSVMKASDESITSDVNRQNDDELLFAVAANEDWAFQVWALVSAGAEAGDINFGLSVPSGATWTMAGTGPTLSATDPLNASGNYEAGGANLGFGIDATLKVGIILTGYVSVGGTPGTVTLMWAQWGSDATATTVEAGSWLLAHRIE